MSRRLSQPEVAAALRDAAYVARGDRDHDLATALDVLARDHRHDLRDPWKLEQLRDTVVDFAGGRRDQPIAAAREWCRTHGASLPELIETAAYAVEPANSRTASRTDAA